MTCAKRKRKAQMKMNAYQEERDFIRQLKSLDFPDEQIREIVKARREMIEEKRRRAGDRAHECKKKHHLQGDYGPSPIIEAWDWDSWK